MVLTSRGLLIAVGAGVLALSVAGCSGGPPIPKTVPVSGKVLYQDKPIADAEVGFVPKKAGGDVLGARGATNAAGEFTLKTYIDPQHEVSGATPGEYVVTVQKADVPADPAEMVKKFRENPTMTAKSLVPDKYGGTESPLTATVKAEGTNSFEFKLTDD